MHEFSLAEEIIGIVQDSAVKAGKNMVSKLILEIGQLSGVEESALNSALEVLLPEAGFLDVSIEIIRTKGQAHCLNCHLDFELDDLYTLCPTCKCYEKKIIAGKDFKVLAMEVE